MAPRLKISGTDEELRNLYHRQSWTYQDIADAYGATAGAVFQRFEKMGETEEHFRNPLTRHLRVAQEHKDAEINAKLRSVGRIVINSQNGLPLEEGLSERQLREADSLMRILADNNLIVVYSRSTGWGYAERRPEDGEGPVIVKHLAEIDGVDDYQDVPSLQSIMGERK